MEAGEGRVYKETVYRPKDTKERAWRKRRLIMIIVVVLLLILIIALIIGIAVSKSKGAQPTALFVYPQTEGHPIKFKSGDQSSYSQYVASIDNILKEYSNEKQQGENVIDCSGGDSPQPNSESVCRFDLDNLGSSCTSDNHYGFFEGLPCFLLQFKPPKDWQPQYFTNATFPKDLPAKAQSVDHVPIQCEPSSDQMADSVGEMEIYPVHGFPSGFFPYSGQSEYKPPLVMVRLKKPKYGEAIGITCTVLDPVLDKENNEAFIVDVSFLID